MIRYAPKFMTWQERFDRMIEGRAAEALAEIKAMADEARAKFKKKVFRSVPIDNSLWDAMQLQIYGDQMRGIKNYGQQYSQLAAMQNPYLYGLYQCDCSNMYGLSPLGGILGKYL